MISLVHRISQLAIGTLLLGVGVLPHVVHAEPRQPPVVLGWLEEAQLGEGQLSVHAKLDTGADTSSIHAQGISLYAKEGKQWVRFTITNRYGDSQTFERAVRRTASIKRKGGDPQVRPVVRLDICVGQILEVVEFSLVDRSNFSSTALIGRNFLAGKVLVDSSVSYSSTPRCSDQNS